MNAAPHHKVLIVGGGTAGITVAARLARKLPGSDIGLIDPPTNIPLRPKPRTVQHVSAEEMAASGTLLARHAQRDFVVLSITNEPSIKIDP